MIVEDFEKYSSTVFDAIIIGSGPAGLTLALKLEEKKFNVAVIEAGERYYSEESQNYYKGEATKEFPRPIELTRLSMFGGTMGHWGGTCRPLDSYDFSRWPIKKENLDSYLDEATKLLDINNSFRNEIINEKLKLIEFQVSEARFGEKYYEHISKSKYIKLFLHSPMIKFKSSEFQINKIKIYSEQKKDFFHLQGKVFVLATGGIENSRILLNEKLRNSNYLLQNLPIGNYWYEHPFNELGKAFVNKNKLKKNLNTSLNHFVNMFNAGNNSDAYSISPTEKLILEKKILNSCCWLVTHERKNDDWKDITKNLLCIAPNLSKNFLKLIDKNVACGATIYSSWEQDPEYSNRVTLSSKKDKFDNFQPELIYKKSELVRNTAKVIIEEIGKYLVENDIGRISGYDFLFEKNLKYISEAGYHHMGGTIMGENPKDSVVDKNLKIHGSKNLFVIGSSVFPSGGHANPTLTIVQLSLRLNEHLQSNFLKIEI